MLRTVDLRKLNSLTKYPSIATYHELDPKGGLLENPTRFGAPIIATEKVDGTNARIVQLPDRNYLIGSREEFLYARGDLLANPAMGIAEALRPLAERLPPCEGAVRCVYGEFYGAKVTAASKHYTSTGTWGFRLFDVSAITDYATLLELPLEQISAWRENTGPAWLVEAELAAFASNNGLETTPRVWTGEALPLDFAGMEAWLLEVLPRTLCALDDKAFMNPEGLVLRTFDRSQIAKARLEDYARTRRRRGVGEAR